MAEAGALVRVGQREVRITRPEKILFPEDGITKGELIEYYYQVATWILPHLRDRPLSLERYPDGIGQPGFFQKSAPHYYPRWIRTVTVKKAGGIVKHVVCNDAATLVYLANQACVTPHIWLSRIDRLDHPDQMVFDLDPSGESFEPVKATARSLKDLLDGLGLPAYLKTTGSRGLHVMVPLKRTEGFDSVRAFAEALARVLVEQDPKQRTLERLKSRRGSRVYLDINRNAYAQMVAPAYAVRPRLGAPVSVPLDWGELGKRSLRPDGFTIRNVFARLEKGKDPWADFWRRGVSLSRARQRLEDAMTTTTRRQLGPR